MLGGCVERKGSSIVLSEVSKMAKKTKQVRFVGALDLMGTTAEPLPTRELVMRHFMAGDFERLMAHYQPLIVSKALKHASRLGEEVLDLIQEINLRIFTALKAWREGLRALPRGKFLSFWVEVEAIRAIREWFYRRGASYTSSRAAAKIRKAALELQVELGREPTPEEIARKLGLGESDVWVIEEHLALMEAERLLSLDEVVRQEDSSTRFADFAQAHQEEDEDPFEALEEALDRYRIREKIGQAEAEALEKFLNGEEIPEQELTVLEKAIQRAMTQRQVQATRAV